MDLKRNIDHCENCWLFCFCFEMRWIKFYTIDIIENIYFIDSHNMFNIFNILYQSVIITYFFYKAHNLFSINVLDSK